MNRAVCVILLASGLGGVYRAWAAGPDGTGGRSIDVAFLHLVFVLHTGLPSGTLVICKASLDAENLRPESAKVAAGRATIGGSSTACAIEVPSYSFSERRQGSTVLRYEIEIERQPGNSSIPIAHGILPAPLVSPPSAAVVDMSLGPPR